jgi:hypothetical protein
VSTDIALPTGIALKFKIAKSAGMQYLDGSSEILWRK